MAATYTSSSTIQVESSEQLRRKGNDMRARALAESCSAFRRAKLEECIRLYKKSLSAAGTPGDKASSLKNIAVAMSDMVRAMLENDWIKGEDLQLLLYYFRELVTSFASAAKEGQLGKSSDWRDHLAQAFQVNMKAIEAMILESNVLTFPMRERMLLTACEVFSWSSITANCMRPSAALLHLKHATFYFHRAVEAYHEMRAGGEQAYPRCLSKIKSCFPPLALAEHFADGKEEIVAALTLLKEDVLLYQYIFEAQQAIAGGDELFFAATRSSEEVNMEGVWDALDKFKEATLLTREKDLETEAWAMSRLGGVYAKVLLMPDVAHRYYNQSVTLGLTVVQQAPRIATTEWFKEAVLKVDEYQQKRQREEEKEKEKEKEPFLKKLGKEFKELKREAEKGVVYFLQFVYGTHPPKKESQTLGDLDGGNDQIKKTLVRAISHYHPDKNRSHGRDWEVLCDEITKMLNCKYENFKAEVPNES